MYLFDYYVYNINKKRNFTKMFTPSPPLKKFLDLQVINILHVTENCSYIHRSLCKNITSNANDDLNNEGYLYFVLGENEKIKYTALAVFLIV